MADPSPKGEDLEYQSDEELKHESDDQELEHHPDEELGHQSESPSTPASSSDSAYLIYSDSSDYEDVRKFFDDRQPTIFCRYYEKDLPRAVVLENRRALLSEYKKLKEIESRKNVWYTEANVHDDRGLLIMMTPSGRATSMNFVPWRRVHDLIMFREDMLEKKWQRLAEKRARGRYRPQQEYEYAPFIEQIPRRRQYLREQAVAWHAKLAERKAQQKQQAQTQSELYLGPVSQDFSDDDDSDMPSEPTSPRSYSRPSESDSNSDSDSSNSDEELLDVIDRNAGDRSIGDLHDGEQLGSLFRRRQQLVDSFRQLAYIEPSGTVWPHVSKVQEIRGLKVKLHNTGTDDDWVWIPWHRIPAFIQYRQEKLARRARRMDIVQSDTGAQVDPPTLSDLAVDEVMKRAHVISYVLPLVKIQLKLLPSGQHKDLLNAVLTQWAKLEEENAAHPDAVQYMYVSLVMIESIVHILQSLMTKKLGLLGTKVVNSLVHEISTRL